MKLILALLLSLCFQLAYTQHILPNDKYAYHSFELLGGINLTIETFEKDSISVKAFARDFYFELGKKDKNSKNILRNVSWLIRSKRSDDYHLYISIEQDTLLLIENYIELPEKVFHPIQNQYGEDSLIYDKDGNIHAQYLSVKDYYKENSMIYDLRNQEYLINGAFEVFGSRIKNSDNIQFSKLGENENYDPIRIIFDFNIKKQDSEQIGLLKYEDKGINIGVVPTGIATGSHPLNYNYQPDNLFWDRINSIDLKKKYHFLYHDAPNK